jgi:hypothetical protein
VTHPQREGRKRAQARGVRFGRPPNTHQHWDALQRLQERAAQADVAGTYNVSQATILRLARAEENSLDHLVGAAEQRQRDGEAEPRSCLEIDDQLEFRGLLDRHVAWLLAIENPAGVDAGQPV